MLSLYHSQSLLQGNATPVFPVCKENSVVNNANSAITSTSTHTQSNTAHTGSGRYKYELSICTATERTDRDKLVEWIEYHLLQGK